MLTLPPLSLYIHFPWCIRKCPYCDFNSHPLRSELPEKEYINALLRDLENKLPQVHARPLHSIFMGGGTPSLFSAESITYLLAELKKRLCFSEDIEITLEANPGTTEYLRFQGYRSAGVNRLSLGIQSFEGEQLKKLGRIHNCDQAYQAIEQAQAAGFSLINIDLMYGLPNQSIEAALADLRQALQFSLAHLSWYQLTLEPNTEFARQPPPLPADDQIAALHEQGIKSLRAAGYKHYEISAYSRPHAACRHNRNYWEFGDYIGIGAGAHSKLSDETTQRIVRSWNWKQPRQYLMKETCFTAEEKIIPTAELAFEFMLNALRLVQPIPLALFEARTGLSRQVIANPLEEGKRLGLFQPENTQCIELTAHGRNFCNEAILLFLP